MDLTLTELVAIAHQARLLGWDCPEDSEHTPGFFQVFSTRSDLCELNLSVEVTTAEGDPPGFVLLGSSYGWGQGVEPPRAVERWVRRDELTAEVPAFFADVTAAQDQFLARPGGWSLP